MSTPTSIELHITPTFRKAGAGEAWMRTADLVEHFDTMTAAKNWCEDVLGRRRAPIYRDQKNGPPLKVGAIYSSKERDMGHTYYRQYWVTAYAVERTPLINGASL